MIIDCNRCNVGAKCRGAANAGMMANCKRFAAPYDTWKLAELALVNPTGLSGALSALPFETNIMIHLEEA